MDRFQQNDLHIASCVGREKAQELLEAIQQQRYSVTHVFKDEPRTYIARIELEGDAFVYKIPRGRYNRRWERQLTRFRDGEALRHFDSMATLTGLGFGAPEPIMAAEERHGGVAIDGFLLYRFAEGTQADKRHAALITPELLKLHSLGYMRRDAHAKNYLIDEHDNVIFIDFRLKRPRIFRQTQLQIELAKYLRTMPNGWEHLPDSLRHSLMLRINAWISRQFRDMRYVRRRLKAAARKLLGRS